MSDYPHNWNRRRLAWFYAEWKRREAKSGELTVGQINKLCHEAVTEH